MATSDENTKKLEAQLSKLDDKIDIVIHTCNQLNINMAENNVILQDHTRRSTMLEEQMKPIQAHVDGIKGTVKFLKIIAVLAAIAEAIHIVMH